MNLGHVHSFRAAVLSALGLVFIALIGAIAHQPLLFPSLGPTIFVITLAPNEPTARFLNIIIGHSIGILSALITIPVIGLVLYQFPNSEMSTQLAYGLSAALAVSLTVMLQVKIRALHPPAAATTMLLVLGGVRAEWPAIMYVMGSIIFVAVYGELIRFLQK